MIDVISDLPDNVLGLTASGEVTADDYKTVLVPALEEKLSKHKKIRLLYATDNLLGFTGGAAWEDAKIGMMHLTAFERIAVVTDTDWLEKMVKAFGFVMPGEVRVFHEDKLKEARSWVAE